MIELERSGIRDGDGLWHGSDALEGTVAAISDCYVTELESSGIPPKVNGAPLEDEIPWDAPVDRLKVAQREIITTFLARHDLVGLTDWIMETAIRGNADPRSAEVTAKALPRILASDDLTDEIPF